MFKHLGLIQSNWWKNQALCIRHERHLNKFQFGIYVWHFQDLLLSHFLSRKLGLCFTQLFKHFQINTFGEKKSGWRMYLLPLLIHNFSNKPRQLFIFNLFRAECVRKFSQQPKEFHLLIANILDWHRCNLIRVSVENDMRREVASIVYLYYMLG